MTFKNGKKRPKTVGKFPVYGGNGILGYTNEWNNENCVVIGRVGAYCGSVFREYSKCWISDNAICGISNNDNIEYLYYLLSSLQLNHRHIGTSQPLLTQEILNNIQVTIPPYVVQNKIALILRSLDDKIELNNKVNENLEQQARAIYAELAQNAFEKKQLYDFIRIKHGFAFKGDFISTEDNGIVLVTPGNFKIGGGFKENKCKFFTGEYPGEYLLKAGELIVTMTDLSKAADTLGVSALVPNSSVRVYLHNQRIGLVKALNDELPLPYIYWYMRSYEYHMSIVGSASGSTVKHTSPGRILEQFIPIPERQTLFKNAAVLEAINNSVSQNNAENIYLSSLRDTLLPRLMSGEIDVSAIQI